jgi:hypothetical protein
LLASLSRSLSYMFDLDALLSAAGS